MTKTEDCLVILDGGHDIYTAGKRTPTMPDGTVIKENEFNDAVVAVMKTKLEARGYTVYITAPELGYVALETRTDRANTVYSEWRKTHDKTKCVFLSVHFNALDGIFNGKEGGIETFAYKAGTEAERFAQCIQSAVVGGTPQYDRGVKINPFWVLRKTWMVAALVEFGYMDKLVEALLMKKPEFIEECAEEACTGIANYLGVETLPDEVSILTKRLDALEQGLIDIVNDLDNLLQHFKE